MNKTIHEVQQGSEEWLALRSQYFTASEAPAMMGASKYLSRSDLLRQKATGITPSVDAVKQRLFDAGHEAEAMARLIVEAMIHEDLYPVTVSVEIDGLKLLASMDGLTMDETTGWENKLYNKELEQQVLNDDLEPHYYWQLEQELLVSGCEKIIFTTSDGTPERTIGVTYTSNPERRETLIAGWKQFATDLANYQHVEIAERPKADVVVDLPALFVHAKGEITTHNMDEFGKALALRLAETRAIVLVTDQDFSNAKESAKKFRETAKAIALSKEQMLAQTETIGEAARKMDTWAKDLNATALQLEKDVEREDKAKKEVMVLGGKNAYTEHIAALEAEIAPIRLNLTAPIFAEAIKNKRNYASMQDAVDTMLAGAKVVADSAAKDVRAKLAWCKEHAAGHSALFPDLQQIIGKPMDDFTLTITSRIEKAKAEEAEKLEAERQRIRAEEEARAAAKLKADQEEAARLEAQANNATATARQNTGEEGTRETPALGQRETLSEAPTITKVLHATAPEEIANAIVPIDTGARMKLGDINARLYPLSVDAAVLKHIGFEPVSVEKNAKLYRAQDFQFICYALVQHITTAANKEVKEAA